MVALFLMTFLLAPMYLITFLPNVRWTLSTVRGSIIAFALIASFQMTNRHSRQQMPL
jgi:hypothetical protein